jgi:solute carrier family 45 protein 1/2/4
MRPRSSDEVDELYKVVSPIESDDWQGDADENTKSSWYLILLTLSGLGLQIGWSVETSNGSVSVLEFRAMEYADSG